LEIKEVKLKNVSPPAICFFHRYDNNKWSHIGLDMIASRFKSRGAAKYFLELTNDIMGIHKNYLITFETYPDKKLAENIMFALKMMRKRQEKVVYFNMPSDHSNKSTRYLYKTVNKILADNKDKLQVFETIYLCKEE